MGLQAKLKDQKIKKLQKELQAQKKEKQKTAAKHVKSNDIFAWFDGKKPKSDTATIGIKQIMKKKVKPEHKPGEWYKDKWGWKQEPDPDAEAKRKKMAKEHKSKLTEKMDV